MSRAFNKETTRIGWKAEKNNNDRENTARSNAGLPRHGGDEDTTHPSEIEAMDEFDYGDHGQRRRGGNRNPQPVLSKAVAVVPVTSDKKTLQKQLQKLTRKLQEIDQLEESGKILNPEQQKKLDSKSQVEEEIAQVQAALK